MIIYALLVLFAIIFFELFVLLRVSNDAKAIITLSRRSMHPLLSSENGDDEREAFVRRTSTDIFTATCRFSAKFILIGLVVYLLFFLIVTQFPDLRNGILEKLASPAAIAMVTLAAVFAERAADLRGTFDGHAADGTPLNAYLIKPSDFDPSRDYALLIHTYGGPGSQEVRNAWAGTERLWHHFLAEEYGILVAGVDNRGTGGRGKAFKTLTQRRLGILEAEDQIDAAAKAIAPVHEKLQKLIDPATYPTAEQD